MKKYIAFIKDWSNQSTYIGWLAHYTKPFIPYIILMMIFSSVSTLSSIGLSVVTQKIIDSTDFNGELQLYIFVYIGIVVLSEVISVISALISVVIDEKFGFGVRKQVFDRILNTKWLKLATYHTGDLMTRLTSDTSSIATGISKTIPDILVLVLELIATFVTLYIYNKTLAIFALLFAPFAVLSSFILGKKLKKLQVKVLESESTYRSFIQESLSNLLIVKTFCDEPYSSQKLEELQAERFKWVLKKSKMSLFASTVMNGTFQLSYIVAFIYGVMGITNGTITFGKMTVFLTLVNRIQGPLMDLANSVPKIISVLASAGRIMEIQDLELEESQQTKLDQTQIGLEIKDVSFGYTDEMVIEDATLRIEPGEFVAIVGESGIGKTTMIRLIMSFVDSLKGKITFFDKNQQVEESNAGSREFISYVPQGNTLFSGTILDSVRMGNRSASEEEVVTALKAACAYQFVSELPEGIHTLIGERGNGLSEGQAQRISIARALVRKAPFLILDEATSSLDEKTELKVLKSIRELKPTPTCLLITHRKSVLEYCDREIKIEDFKLNELQQGNFSM